MANETVVISTVAALAGSAIGAMAPILSNYVLQRATTRRELLTRQIAGREGLYSDFLQSASSLLVHSMTHDMEDPDRVVGLFTLVARMRLVSSTTVVAEGENIARQIVIHYGERNLSIEEIRSSALLGETDPLKEFSVACRKELQELFEKGEPGIHQ